MKLPSPVWLLCPSFWFPLVWMGTGEDTSRPPLHSGLFLRLRNSWAVMRFVRFGLKDGIVGLLKSLSKVVPEVEGLRVGRVCS